MTKKEKDKLTTRLKRSKAYRIAYNDPDFLDTGYARPIRLQAELMKPEHVFQNHLIISTIVVFGGTRIVERSEAKHRVALLERRLVKKPRDGNLRKQLRIARSLLSKCDYYEQARQFSRIVPQEGQRHRHGARRLLHPPDTPGPRHGPGRPRKGLRDDVEPDGRLHHPGQGT